MFDQDLTLIQSEPPNLGLRAWICSQEISWNSSPLFQGPWIRVKLPSCLTFEHIFPWLNSSGWTIFSPKSSIPFAFQTSTDCIIHHCIVHNCSFVILRWSSDFSNYLIFSDFSEVDFSLGFSRGSVWRISVTNWSHTTSPSSTRSNHL